MGALAFTIDRGKLTSHLSATHPFLTTEPAWAQVYAPNVTLLGQGDIAYREKYADTLELFVCWVFSLALLSLFYRQCCSIRPWRIE